MSDVPLWEIYLTTTKRKLDRMIAEETDVDKMVLMATVRHVRESTPDDPDFFARLADATDGIKKDSVYKVCRGERITIGRRRYENYQKLFRRDELPHYDRAWRRSRASRMKSQDDSVEIGSDQHVSRPFSDYRIQGACIVIGRQPTLWLAAHGIGERGAEIKRTLTHCSVDRNHSAIYPRDVSAVVDKLREEAAEFARALQEGQISPGTRPRFANNLCVGLKADGISFWPHAGENEDQRLVLDCYLHDYAPFFAIHNDPVASAWRKARMRDWEEPTQPIEELALAIGASVAVITRDGRFVFGVRAQTQAARAGQLDVGSIEGVKPKDDLPNGSTRFNYYDVFLRGLWEEYALLPDQIEELHVLGFGCDVQYAQWNALGICYTKKTYAQLADDRTRDARDRAELKKLDSAPDSPKELFSFVRNKKIWSCGLATMYYAMVHRHGSALVNAELSDFAMEDNTQYE